MVKPNSGGSSVGVKIVYDKDELISMLETVFEWDSEVVIEKYIKGDEITCSIFDGKQLPIISIRHAAEFFDYNAKYDDAGTIEEVIELQLNLRNVNKASLACYKALKCSVYARVDMMVKDGIPYVMEVNTLPGMTQSEFTTKKCRSRGN